MHNENTVKVWDILVRIFHWSLVLAFVVAYFTGDDENIWHIYSGYVVLGLISFRVVWGIVGTKYARFSNFVYSPKEVINYLTSLRSDNPRHYIGHNPAGGWMIIALLICLFAITITGLKLYAVEEGKGLLAGVSTEISVITQAYADEEHEKKRSINKKEEKFWEELHETFTNITLFLIFLHIGGIVVSSKLHKENLVRAMITGRKKAERI